MRHFGHSRAANILTLFIRRAHTAYTVHHINRTKVNNIGVRENSLVEDADQFRRCGKMRPYDAVKLVHLLAVLFVSKFPFSRRTHFYVIHANRHGYIRYAPLANVLLLANNALTILADIFCCVTSALFYPKLSFLQPARSALDRGHIFVDARLHDRFSVQSKASICRPMEPNRMAMIGKILSSRTYGSHHAMSHTRIIQCNLIIHKRDRREVVRYHDHKAGSSASVQSKLFVLHMELFICTVN